MNPQSETVRCVTIDRPPLDFETIFRAQYPRIARIIARVVRNHARAEELAVEVFVKFWKTPRAHNDQAQGWLYRVAVRKALDELRRETRRTRYERLFGFHDRFPTPEQVHSEKEEQRNVRFILSCLPRRDAALLLLRSQDLSYGELAKMLDLNPASVGTLLLRAQEAFRKEYIKHHGKE